MPRHPPQFRRLLDSSSRAFKEQHPRLCQNNNNNSSVPLADTGLVSPLLGLGLFYCDSTVCDQNRLVPELLLCSHLVFLYPRTTACLPVSGIPAEPAGGLRIQGEGLQFPPIKPACLWPPAMVWFASPFFPVKCLVTETITKFALAHGTTPRAVSACF